MRKETELVEKIFEKYKFLDLIPEKARMHLVKSRSNSLKKCLKKVNDYPFWFSFVLFFFFLMRDFGFKASIVFSKWIALVASLLIAASTAGGGYFAVQIYKNSITAEEARPENKIINQREINNRDSAFEKSENKNVEIRSQVSGPLVEIVLYSGKKYRGVIKSRGSVIVIETENGEVTIPANKLRIINPIR